MTSILINILSLILSFNLTLYYLDDFNISKNKILGTLQLLSPLLIIIIGCLIYIKIYYTFDNLITYNLLGEGKDINPNINVGANIEINKEAAVEISKGISSLGRNIGLTGCVGAMTAGAAKILGNSTLPPVQKLGILTAAGAIGGAIQIATSTLNNLVDTSSSSSPVASSSVDSTLKFIGEYNSSPLVNLILSIDAITVSCLTLAIILFNIIIFKLILNENNIKLNLSNIVGIKLNNNINYYLIKIVQLNKSTSSIYMFIALIVLIIGLSFNLYFITQLHNNLDLLINLHVK